MGRLGRGRNMCHFLGLINKACFMYKLEIGHWDMMGQDRYEKGKIFEKKYPQSWSRIEKAHKTFNHVLRIFLAITFNFWNKLIL